MKILASDFDNTLYIKNENELNKNILALKKYLSKGNLFCIITGRSYTSVKKLFSKEFKNYILPKDKQCFSEYLYSEERLIGTIKMEKEL